MKNRHEARRAPSSGLKKENRTSTSGLFYTDFFIKTQSLHFIIIKIANHKIFRTFHATKKKRKKHDGQI